MKLVWFLIGYTTISMVLYIAIREKCKRNAVFRFIAPKSAAIYYLLSFTWGLPMTLIGCVVAVIMLYSAVTPKRFGRMWCFELPNINWGVSFGIFCIAPRNSTLKAHEHGHGIQNVYLGMFMPAVVGIPSIIRFWYRDIRQAIGKPCKNGYDDVWFEKSATESGAYFTGVSGLSKRDS